MVANGCDDYTFTEDATPFNFQPLLTKNNGCDVHAGETLRWEFRTCFQPLLTKNNGCDQIVSPQTNPDWLSTTPHEE
jgi:hypothetical protein